jgi:cytochrome c oxidase cbb3-type subunit I/II
LRHFESPPSTSPGSVMPPYPHLLEDTIPWNVIQDRVDAMAMLGVPYDINNASSAARTQADELAAKLRNAGGPGGMENKEVIALIAYMQRLGVDIRLSMQGGTK